MVCAAALFAVCGCNNPMPPDPDATRTDGGPVDAFRDCNAVCIRSTSSACECTFPCGGHVTTAACDATSCQCAIDGTPTMSFSYTICGPEQFIPGCHPELSPDAGRDGGPNDAGSDAGSTDAGDSDASLVDAAPAA
jgi:hypothetical protein